METMPASDGPRNERFPPGQTGTRGRHRAIWKSKRGRHVEPERSATAEREELNRLRRENRQLKLEREILSNRRGSAPPVV